MTNRRQFIIALASTTALAACSVSPQLTSQTISDILSIGSGLSGALGSVAAIPQYSSIAPIVTKIQSVVSGVNSMTPISSAQSSVQQIESLINNLLSITAGIALPTPFGPALAAASILLPVIEAAVGMLVSQPATARFGASAMTADQARQILANASQGR